MPAIGKQPELASSLKKKFQSFLLLPFIMGSFLGCMGIAFANPLPTQTIHLQRILNFDTLKPAFNAMSLNRVSLFTVDNEENIYCCDYERNRFLKFTLKGEYKGQIGGAGKNKENSSLHYPTGIHFNGGTLYILDYSGEYVKMFTPSGKFLSSFKPGKDVKSYADGIAVKDSSIFFLDARYKEPGWENHKLISVFNKKGVKIDSFGKPVPTDRFITRRAFGGAYLIASGDKIYGAFAFSPVIFCYSTKGQELLYKNLSLFSIDPELDPVLNVLPNEDEILDSQGKKNPLKTISMRYAYGLVVDPQGNFYISLNDFDRYKSYILKLDSCGTPLEKIEPVSGNKPIFPLLKIYRTPKGRFFLIGKYLGTDDIYLFEWIEKK